MGQAITTVLKDLDAIMAGFDRSDHSANRISDTAVEIVALAKSYAPKRNGFNDPVLQRASEYLEQLAGLGYDVGHIRSLLQGLANHFDGNFRDNTPRFRTGPVIYEG